MSINEGYHIIIINYHHRQSPEGVEVEHGGIFDSELEWELPVDFGLDGMVALDRGSQDPVLRDGM